MINRHLSAVDVATGQSCLDHTCRMHATNLLRIEFKFIEQCQRVLQNPGIYLNLLSAIQGLYQTVDQYNVMVERMGQSAVDKSLRFISSQDGDTTTTSC